MRFTEIIQEALNQLAKDHPELLLGTLLAALALLVAGAVVVLVVFIRRYKAFKVTKEQDRLTFEARDFPVIEVRIEKDDSDLRVG